MTAHDRSLYKKLGNEISCRIADLQKTVKKMIELHLSPESILEINIKEKQLKTAVNALEEKYKLNPVPDSHSLSNDNQDKDKDTDPLADLVIDLLKQIQYNFFENNITQLFSKSSYFLKIEAKILGLDKK